MNNVNAKISQKSFQFCFINIVFTFQREFIKNMQTIEKINFYKICKRRKYVNLQYKHDNKNYKILQKLHEIFIT